MRLMRKLVSSHMYRRTHTNTHTSTHTHTQELCVVHSFNVPYPFVCSSSMQGVYPFTLRHTHTHTHTHSTRTRRQTHTLTHTFYTHTHTHTHKHKGLQAFAVPCRPFFMHSLCLCVLAEPEFSVMDPLEAEYLANLSDDDDDYDYPW